MRTTQGKRPKQREIKPDRQMFRYDGDFTYVTVGDADTNDEHSPISNQKHKLIVHIISLGDIFHVHKGFGPNVSALFVQQAVTCEMYGPVVTPKAVDLKSCVWGSALPFSSTATSLVNGKPGMVAKLSACSNATQTCWGTRQASGNSNWSRVQACISQYAQ